MEKNKDKMIMIKLEKYADNQINQKHKHCVRIEKDREYFLPKEYHKYDNYIKEYTYFKDCISETNEIINKDKELQKEIRKLQKKIDNRRRKIINKVENIEEDETIIECRKQINDIKTLKKSSKNLPKIDNETKNFSSFLISFGREIWENNERKDLDFKDNIEKKLEEYYEDLCNRFNLKKVYLTVHYDEGRVIDGIGYHNIHAHLLTYRRQKDLTLSIIKREDLEQEQTNLYNFFKEYGFKRGETFSTNVGISDKDYADKYKRETVLKERKTVSKLDKRIKIKKGELQAIERKIQTSNPTILNMERENNIADGLIFKINELMETDLYLISDEKMEVFSRNILLQLKQIKNNRITERVKKTLNTLKKLRIKAIKNNKNKIINNSTEEILFEKETELNNKEILLNKHIENEKENKELFNTNMELFERYKDLMSEEDIRILQHIKTNWK